MSMPDPQDGQVAQVLIKLGEMSTQLAVQDTKLNTVIAQLPDHEARIRKLEAWRYGLPITGLVSFGSAALAIWGVLKK
jgi:hypothetical protein